MPSSPTLARGPAERALAWLYTGPLGHLYAVLADIGELFARYGALRLGERLRG